MSNLRFEIQYPKSHQRRGALLLVCLSLLVLFAVITVTFVLIAGQYAKTLKTTEIRVERYGDDYKKQFDNAFGDLIRGTTNTRSSLLHHDFLGDIYGNDGIAGEIAANSTAPQSLVSGQIIQLPPIDASLLPARMKVSGYLNGLLFTFTSGPAKGITTRIVGYSYNSTPPETGILRVLAFDGLDTATFLTNFNSYNVVNSIPARFVINGRPFNGSGFGFNASTGRLDAKDNNNSFLALLPHYRFVVGAPDTGGVDEDFDAADSQNMALAFIIPGATLSNQIMPSFHRPDLVNYWINNLPTPNPAIVDWATLESNDPDFARRIVLRPLNRDNPNFTGSNPNFNAVTGPWDVDNDGDGVPDSIWLDLGLPVQTAADGRQFRPLFAILCQDLDGRLNVNAHGSLAEIDAGTNGTFGDSDDNYSRTVNGTDDGLYFAGAAGPNYDMTNTALPRGQGYGPAEITLRGLWDSTEQVNRYPALFAGNTTWEGRYGERANLATAPPNFPNASFPKPGKTYSISSIDDPLSALKQFDQYAVPNAYGSPNDIWGRGFLGLDVRGMPLQPWPTPATELLDDPYEINLSRTGVRATQSNNGVDNLFTVAELERLLRPFDIDTSSLPKRLRDLVSSDTPVNPTLDKKLRHLITTETYDVPVAGSISLVMGIDGKPGQAGVDDNGNSTDDDIGEVGAAGSDDWTAILPGPAPSTASAVDLIRYSLRRGGFDISLTNSAAVATQLGKMLPVELISGLKMDINRPFGNGKDDNGDGVVDDPGEVGAEFVWTGTVPSGFGSIVFDAGNDNGVTALLARQAYARYLYILMMALVGDAKIDFDNVSPSNDSDTETARGLAQWAINVVDFRDRDSIMTPFEYDEKPFDADGWSVDGNLNTDVETNRKVVWGCERPELLITETLAWHDRRTEDLDSGDKLTSDTTTPDADFDQRLVPSGKAFIELYNPWTAPPVLPGEFCFDTAWASGVLLQKQATAGGISSPIWRLIVVQGPSKAESVDPDDVYATSNAFDPADVERIVYFRDVSTASKIPSAGSAKIFFHGGTAAPLVPGHYALVGSTGIPDTGTFVIPMGRPTAFTENAAAANDYSTSRRIILSPDTDPTVQQVDVRGNAPATSDIAAADIKPTIAVIVDQIIDSAGTAQARSFSVSEPLDGYDAAETPDGAGNGEDVYLPAKQQPADFTKNLADWAATGKNVTTVNFRRVHLQRLANPLSPWNPPASDTANHVNTLPVNPYLTVDSASMDLTAFNGVTADPDPNNPDPPGWDNVYFRTAQRGAANDKLAPRNLFRQEPLRDLGAVGGYDATRTATSASYYFPYQLEHTLGYLNSPWHPFYASATPPPNAQYLGDPNSSAIQPFTWLSWNNRPFLSAPELMQVPKSRSSRLAQEFNHFGNVTALAAPEKWPYERDSTKIQERQFNHLLNFFERERSGASDVSARLHRLFNFAGVPSPYVGTETYLNPTTFTGPDMAAGVSTGRDGLHPPFNKVSNYRDPGKINANTIGDQIVLDGVFNGRTTPTSGSFFASRRGYGSDTDPMITTNPSSPTVFANPFRSDGNSNFVLPGASGSPRDIDLTLLRPSDPTSVVPLFVNTATQAHRNVDRSAAFRYQDLSRISNLVTTRSNVYAIWITMGYFEVSPRSADYIHPDGYELTQELGAETGEITRHRAFYIYDRSIPVGYQRGKDLNTERGILLKRIIE